MILRAYQQRALDDLRRAFGQGHKSVVMVMPTGSGKTRLAAEVAKSAISKNRKVLFLAPRRELVYQTVKTFGAVDIESSIIMAGESRSMFGQADVASVPTLHARCVQTERMAFPQADVVIVDEAHIGVDGSSQNVIEHYLHAGAVVIGLTATPARVDGKGLGRIYDEMVLGPSVAELTKLGHLAPARYFAGPRADLESVAIRAGDYAKGELAEACDTEKLVGDVVENWLKIAPTRQTFVYAVNRAHARHLCEQFRNAGVKAGYVDGQTPHDERAQIQENLASGDIQVLCNVGVLVYGIDCPPVNCIVLACPTKSLSRYLQMAGRGLRPYDGKNDCIIISHSNTVDELGFVDDPMPWSLDDSETVQDRKERQKQEAKEPKTITCKECSAEFRAAPACPECGHEMKSTYQHAIATLEAELLEIERSKKRKRNREWTADEKRRFYAELRGYAMSKGYKSGWASHKYRERFSVWPNAHKDARMVQPSEETLGWIKSRIIAAANRKAA